MAAPGKVEGLPHRVLTSPLAAAGAISQEKMPMSVRLPSLFILALCAIASLLSVRAEEPAEKEKFVLSKEEKRLLDLTNVEREKEKLQPLVPSPVLFKVARAHSANMARQEKMSHELDGKNPYMRLKEAGYRYRYAGENVAYGDVDLDKVMKGWMDSPGHRKNILTPGYTEIGLAAVRSEEGLVYYTQVFGTPRKTN
jgi:uncharacterized protein YkwD